MERVTSGRVTVRCGDGQQRGKGIEDSRGRKVVGSEHRNREPSLLLDEEEASRNMRKVDEEEEDFTRMKKGGVGHPFH